MHRQKSRRIDASAVAMIVIGVALVAGLAYFGYAAYDYYIGPQYTSGEVVADESRPVKSQTVQDTAIRAPVKDAPDNKEYSDNMVGWLQVDGVDVDDALVQYSDNEYYLKHNEYDENDIWGAYYAMDVNNMSSPESLDRVTVIFGHSNGNSEHLKFSVLKKLRDADFAAENQYIRMWVGDKLTVWQIFAESDYPVEHNYMVANPDDTFFIDEVERMKSLSYNTYAGIDVGVDDKILILSTCTGDNYEQRYLVCAKLIASE